MQPSFFNLSPSDVRRRLNRSRPLTLQTVTPITGTEFRLENDTNYNQSVRHLQLAVMSKLNSQMQCLETGPEAAVHPEDSACCRGLTEN
jgi:hypothetical protein